MNTDFILFPILAYLIGSIPTAVWTGKLFFGKDVRDFGSGNAGATNTFRVLGKKAGIFVLLFDAGKGALSVLLCVWFGKHLGTEADEINLKIICGFAAVLGHIYPIYAGFRGGKGVATVLGFMLALQTYPTLLCAAVFIIVFLIFHYVSVASMSSALCFPIFLFIFFPTEVLSLQILSIVLPLLIVFTHRSNIVKLLNKTESKIYINK